MQNSIKYFLLFLLIFSVSEITPQKVYENRDEIPAQYKWNLNDIYKSWDEWERDLKVLEAKMDEVVQYKGKLKSGPETLLKVQKLTDELGILSYKVYRFPAFTYDLNTKDQEAFAKLQRVQIAFANYSTATSWINPEMLEIPWATMEKWLDGNKEFEPYRFGIENLYRLQSHVLDADKEKLLSYFSRFNSTPNDIYKKLSIADIDYPTVTLSTGEQIKATNGNYYRILSNSRNQEDRKTIFEAHYNTFKQNQNTYAAIYNSSCQSDWATAQARNYSSCLESALEGNNIPVTVYENLVNTVRANTEPLKKYNLLRKKILKLDKYYSYDGSVPLTDFSKTYPYEQAKEWVLASVEPLGKDYDEKYKKALKSGWVDVYESVGKQSGAYSGGVYGVHPYMLMNYNETLDNVFTLAHEMGHTMHTLLADENQPFANSSYTLFVAEVASTFNEALLLDYLLKRTTDPKERIALIQQSIKNIAGTFYLQTQFADYELQVHRLVENGQPITSDVLTGIMDKLNDDYYGDTVEKSELLNYVWARISHFYTVPFYVFQYATCFASSSQLYNEYKTASDINKQKVTERFINLLKSGGNDYPMEQLKKAGVDLTKPEVVKSVINRMNELVELLEQEINKL